MDKKTLGTIAVITGVGLAAAAVVWVAFGAIHINTVQNGYANPIATPANSNSAIVGSFANVLSGLVQNAGLQTPAPAPTTPYVDPFAGATTPDIDPLAGGF